MRRKGWRQHALHWPASAGLAPKFMAYCLLTRLSVATARRRAELSRSDGLHAPSTEQRGYQAAATLHRWECSQSLFRRRACGPAWPSPLGSAAAAMGVLPDGSAKR